MRIRKFLFLHRHSAYCNKVCELAKTSQILNQNIPNPKNPFSKNWEGPNQIETVVHFPSRIKHLFFSKVT